MRITVDLVSKYDSSKAYKGYTFFSPKGSTYNMPGAGGLMLEFDWDGNEVWRYEDPI